jgi:hypothetical protein
MACWQTEMTRITRFLIDDLDASSYDDERLEETILVAAQLMKHEMDFNSVYTIDVDSLTLSPDPTSGNKDDAFINLTCMKTACIILKAEVKAESLKAIVVRDGPSSIDLSGRYAATKDRALKMCEDFEHAKLQYQLGNSTAGQAVVNTWVVGSIAAYEGNL